MTTMVMMASVTKEPKFSNEQRVCFIGGIGTIKGCQIDSGTWTYAVEMELEPDPNIGRVGNETTVLLHEGEILNELN